MLSPTTQPLCGSLAPTPKISRSMQSFRAAPSASVFASHRDSTFYATHPNGPEADLLLEAVDVRPAQGASPWGRFTLTFRGSADAFLPSGTYRMAHDHLDPFNLTLDPVFRHGASPDVVYYDAVFVRPADEVPALGDRSATRSERSLTDNETASRRGFLEKAVATLAGGGVLASLFGHSQAQAAPAPAPDARAQTPMVSNPFIATVILFAGTFAPRGWAFCQGQLLPISQNTALFSLIGTTYGGDGRSSFGLPDLRGRAPIGVGQGPGLSSYREGQRGGTETTTLNVTQMPTHSHTASLPVSSAEGNATTPNGNALSAQPDARGTVPAYTNGSTDGSMTVSNGTAGNNQAHDNRPPYLAMHYIIALQGIYPSRS